MAQDVTQDVYQQVFGLSLASNKLFKLRGTLEHLQKEIETLLLPAVKMVGDGTWEVVWGPVAWKEDSLDILTGSDNTWFVGHHAALPFPDGNQYDTYVVAIAGTAETSPMDMLVEDGDVASIVDFPAWIARGVTHAPVAAEKIDDANGVYISMGTAKGVYQLLNHAAPSQVAGGGQSLTKFLGGLPSGARVIFTGHSLGGALSPTLALTMLKAGLLGNVGAGDVLTFPTAGPTPGNQGFETLFTTTLPDTGGPGYQGWNRNFINTRDIVPQAWCTQPQVSALQNLNNVPGIYGNQPPLASVQFAVDLSVAHANKSGIVYVPLPASTFAGPAPTAPPDSFRSFFSEVLSQHLQAYPAEFGIPGAALPTSSPDDVMARIDKLASVFPVFAAKEPAKPA